MIISFSVTVCRVFKPAKKILRRSIWWTLFTISVLASGVLMYVLSKHMRDIRARFGSTMDLTLYRNAIIKLVVLVAMFCLLQTVYVVRPWIDSLKGITFAVATGSLVIDKP